MELFAIYTAWVNYAAALLVEAETGEAQAESHLRFLQATKLVQSWGGAKEDRVTVAKAERDTDPEVMKAEAAVLGAKSLRKMNEMAYDNCVRYANLISREVTRRTGGRTLQTRADRWTP
jgi:hypothetical protein